MARCISSSSNDLFMLQPIACPSFPDGEYRVLGLLYRISGNLSGDYTSILVSEFCECSVSIVLVYNAADFLSSMAT